MSDVPDFRIPSADEGHESIRAPLAQAIDDLAATVEEVRLSQEGVEDAYYLVDLLFDLLDGALATSDDLTTRLGALEQWRTDLAAASGDVLRVDADTDADGVTVWEWSRVAPDGEVIATGGPHASEVDCWTAAHRANPDL